MKTFLFTLATVLLLASCGNSTATNQEQGQDSAIAQNAPAPSQAKYLSNDLAMQDLYGQVKSVTVKIVDCDSLGNATQENIRYADEGATFFDYDKDGVFTRAYAFDYKKEGYKLVRDHKGRVQQYEEYLEDYDYTFVHKFTYNDQGNILTEDYGTVDGKGSVKNTYAAGILASSYTETNFEGTLCKTKTTYKVLETDKQGNWTRRLRTEDQDVASTEEPDKIVEHSIMYFVEMRTITYY